MSERDRETAKRTILGMLEKRDARGVVEGMSVQSLWKYGDGSFCGCYEGDLSDFWPEARDALQEAIAAAIAAEREACARVVCPHCADGLPDHDVGVHDLGRRRGHRVWAECRAAAIRARGEDGAA